MTMGIEGAFLTTYSHEVTSILGGVYPELVDQQALIDGIISAEEERFGATLDAGEASLAAELDRIGEGEVLSGEVAFKLHDTYGFPIDLTREIAGGAGHDVDMRGSRGHARLVSSCASSRTTSIRTRCACRPTSSAATRSPLPCSSPRTALVWVPTPLLT